MNKKYNIIGIIILIICISVSFAAQGGDKMQSSVQPIKMSQIESNNCNVMSFGAKGDGAADDTEAIKEAVAAALKKNGTVYFPKGTYIVSETISIPKDDTKQLKIKGDVESVIIGNESLNGDMFDIKMKYNFSIRDITLEHRGPSGSTMNNLFLRASNCVFRTVNPDNSSDVVVFHGSDCRIDACRISGANKDAYAIYYSMLKSEISINDYIIDNYISGACRGIMVGDGKYSSTGRCEGLKINGNTFENTGDSQIVVQEILHIDISGNKMSGSKNAIVLRQQGHGADGIFINNNEISSAFAQISTEGAAGTYISMVVASNNVFTGGEYGIYDPVGMNKSFLRENTFRNHTKAGFYAAAIQNIIIQSNYFKENADAFAMNITGSGSAAIANNEVSGKIKLDVDKSKIL